MDDFEKIKSLYEDIITSLLKGGTPKALEEFDLLTEAEKKYILFNITDDSKIKESLHLLNKLNKEKTWNKVIANEKQRPIGRKMILWYGVAAFIVILLSTSYLLNKNAVLQNPTTIVTNNNIKAGTDKAILKLEDGSEAALGKETTYRTDHVANNGKGIVYVVNYQQPMTNNYIAYNTITIPRGGQFFVKLSDGTQVWLNSESQLKYPVTFNEGDTRQVELVYGEAYFDVSPSSLHQGTKFKGFHRSQEVEVLGTEFNIKAYKDETNIYTILVEGKVIVNCQDKKQFPTVKSKYPK